MAHYQKYRTCNRRGSYPVRISISHACDLFRAHGCFATQSLQLLFHEQRRGIDCSFIVKRGRSALISAPEGGLPFDGNEIHRLVDQKWFVPERFLSTASRQRLPSVQYRLASSAQRSIVS